MRVRTLVFLAVLVGLLLAVSFGVSMLWRTIGWLSIPVLLLLIVAGGFGLKLLFVRFLKKLFLAPFQLKGAALKGAEARIHEVLALDGEGARRRMRMDVTIVPQNNPETPFQHWEFGELRLVPFGTPSGPPKEEADDKPSTDDEVESGLDRDEVGLEQLEILTDGMWTEYQGEKTAGPLRVRFVAAVPEDLARVSFRYYFEVFGDVAVPIASMESRAPIRPGSTLPVW